jgi:hypothetical protein
MLAQIKYNALKFTSIAHLEVKSVITTRTGSAFSGRAKMISLLQFEVMSLSTNQWYVKLLHTLVHKLGNAYPSLYISGVVHNNQHFLTVLP